MNLADSLYRFYGYCTNVVDGDTLDIQFFFGFGVEANRRLRLLNVDTPERHQENYEEAKAFTKDKVLEKEIIVQTFKADTFGRYLAEVYYKDGDEYYSLNKGLQDNGLLKPGSKWNVPYE